MTKEKSPVREYRTIINDSGDPGYINRILIAHPVTGLLRAEWMQGRMGQITPVNWSQIQTMEFMQSSYMPLRYQVADAQNLIVKHALEMDMEWLLLWEHDVIPPPDSILKLNRYILDEDVPVVSGLYYTRARPSEPLVFRGRGTTFYEKWKMGDKVWCDGVPTGYLLVHMGLMRSVWDESPEYIIKSKNIVTRRVFDSPRNIWFDQVNNQYNSIQGTSDLDWCNRLMKEKHFEKAGWKKIQRKKYPFLVDTGIFCTHINPDGEQFP
jgi:hypothetical protein